MIKFAYHKVAKSEAQRREAEYEKPEKFQKSYLDVLSNA